jgi:parallel beta-helix repeat protein
MLCVKLPFAVFLATLSGLCVVTIGCSGLGPGNASAATPPQGVAGSISISPKQAALQAGSSLQFKAVATRSAGTDFDWLANGVVGGGSASGTISVSGLYTAPPRVESNTQVAVTVTRKSNPAESGSAVLTILPKPAPVAVSVSPSSASLYPSQTLQFTAKVTGTSNQEASWSVNDIAGGNSSLGTISSTGLYTAPAIPSQSSLTITANSTYAADSSAAAAVSIKAVSWNPNVLGVPWASDFVPIAANQINVKTDPRLTVKAKGDGVTDDTAAIRSAIQVASSTGGGMVYFPASDYKIVTPSGPDSGSPLVVPSRIILRGDSSATSRIFVNDPSAASETDGTWTWGGIDFQGASLSGMTDLGVYSVNSSTSPDALLWNRGSTGVSELFFNNLDIHLANSKFFWFDATNRILIQNSYFDSSCLQNGPIYVVGNSNVFFLTNTITYHYGRVQLQNNTNLLMQGNTLTRDAQNKDVEDGTAIESGGVELSFGQNVQAVDNTIQTLNAPSDESGDGEAIMTQQSTIQDVLDAGSATAITSTSLSDTAALWGPVTVSRLTQYPEVVAILTGPATGEWRPIQGVNPGTKTLTLNEPWSPVPAVGSLYSIFAWTLMNATIRGNLLIDNPNGIVIWDACYNCTVQNNVLTNSRGILLRTIDESLSRSLYPEGRRVHEVAIDGKILGNTVSDTSGVRPAYIALDTEAFNASNYSGMGMIDIQVGGNTLKPYPANPNLNYGSLEISQEGYFPCFFFGPAAVKAPLTTVFQDINFWNNSQSLPVKYGSYFSSYATSQACVTAAAPPVAKTR